ncbi:N-methylhydantoinase B [Desulfurobacterium pacificum]|uniref:N-methylhydantoinase B n=1 Tax=Desulfurobacterium pacificum TaxID=240166 RepID=A0ABY1NQD6_9BACT|nr:hydantoinase B/oxoprolinase family protein [Desulfurobacterium pacificum]SMP15277.1 N-methylhydantoinase B [Desulfurobacterium pacificum]
MQKVNPILLEIFRNRFSSVAEEMGVVLQRTAFSPNIKERRDFSCAVFDENGELVAQAAHIPVHLGSMPLSVKSVIENLDLKEGDMAVLNDPFMGGTHLPDVTVVAPVYVGGKVAFYVANRAHHADIGGFSPGSMPLSNSIFQEGLRIPPLKIVKSGEINEEVMNFICANVRTPEERRGDFASQIMANRTGIKRLKEIIEKYSLEEVKRYSAALMDYSEKIMRKTIENIPDGVYEFEDFMEDDGLGAKDVKIKVKIVIKGDKAVVDFSESDLQVEGSINSVRAITLSAVLYVFRCLVKEDIPVNAGCMRPITVITKKGTIVDAEFPAAVSAGNVETSQRIVDVLLGALSKALPDFIPAASQGTMNNVTFGGINPETRKPFTYYETIGGGMGAWAGGDGESAVHSHMTNTLNTPVEAIEFEYPVRVLKYRIRKGSGGKGLHKGGDGIEREFLFLTDVEVTVISERRRIPPYGLFGGEPGLEGENEVVKGGKREKRGGKFTEKLSAGDILTIKTPGGGGWGNLK